MALAFTDLLRNASTTDGDPFTIPSHTVTNGRLYLVGTVHSTTVTVSSVTLAGSHACTEVWTQARGTLFFTGLYYVQATSTATGTGTIDYSGSATGHIVMIMEITGHDPTTPVITANRIRGNSTDSSAPFQAAITLPLSFGDATNNAAVAAWGANNNGTFSSVSGSGWTMMGTTVGHDSPTRMGAMLYRVGQDDLVADVESAASSQYAGVAVEINAAAAVAAIPSLVMPPPIPA